MNLQDLTHLRVISLLDIKNIVNKVQAMINHLENQKTNQNLLYKLSTERCGLLQAEMDERLETRQIKTVFMQHVH